MPVPALVKGTAGTVVFTVALAAIFFGIRWGSSADTNGGGQTVVCKIALHKKNVKLRNETLPLHKKNVKLHIFLVTRPPLAIVASPSDGALHAVRVAKNCRRL